MQRFSFSLARSTKMRHIMRNRWGLHTVANQNRWHKFQKLTIDGSLILLEIFTPEGFDHMRFSLSRIDVSRIFPMSMSIFNAFLHIIFFPLFYSSDSSLTHWFFINSPKGVHDHEAQPIALPSPDESSIPFQQRIFAKKNNKIYHSLD